MTKLECWLLYLDATPLRTVAACEPNPGHRVIAEVQRQKPSTVIITQNIDGMHQRAGAADVVELHGGL